MPLLLPRDPNKPRLTVRERFRATAAKILPRSTAGHRQGAGCVRSLASATVKILLFPRAARDVLPPDAELVQLVERYIEVHGSKIEQAAVCHETDRRETELRAAIQIPEALFYRREDVVHSSMRGLIRRRGDRNWYGDCIDVLRGKPQTLQDFTNCVEIEDEHGKGLIPGEKPDPKAQARGDEIVAAWDAWQAELEQARIVSGEKEATDRYLALADEEDELLLQILAVPAATLAGAMAKARCAKLECSYLDGLEKQIEDQMADEGGPTSEALCTAVVRDLLRIAGEPA